MDTEQQAIITSILREIYTAVEEGEVPAPDLEAIAAQREGTHHLTAPGTSYILTGAFTRKGLGSEDLEALDLSEVFGEGQHPPASVAAHFNRQLVRVDTAYSVYGVVHPEGMLPMPFHINAMCRAQDRAR